MGKRNKQKFRFNFQDEPKSPQKIIGEQKKEIDRLKRHINELREELNRLSPIAVYYREAK
jgi:polyhydroxyalkanoate synthesis regulator phasin